jgi:phosphatidylserine decarboxylase
MQTIRSVIAPIHPDGYRFVAIFAVVAAVFLWLWAPLGWLGVVATLWCVYFFRDPYRVTPVAEGLVVSPADGVVQSIEAAVPPAELGMGEKTRTRIAVFMNVFDVHVNRVPADGEITAVAYRPGAFLNASLDKASEENERQAVRMTTADDKDIAFVQIAGLVARRIVSGLYEGQSVLAGERFGLIRFGSRVDVYLDEGQVPMVLVGQRAIAGETVLADAQGRRPERREEER